MLFNVLGRKSLGGFTMIELIVVIALLSILLFSIGILGGSCSGLVVDNTVTTEQNARNWANSLGMQVEGINCAQVDSDTNSYYSCTISHREGDKLAITAVECTGGGLVDMRSDCRIPKAVIQSY